MKWWHWVFAYVLVVFPLVVLAQYLKQDKHEPVVSQSPVECVVSLQYPRETHVWRGFVNKK